MKVDIYNKTGGKDGAVSLPEEIFGVDLNEKLIHQVAVALMANARPTVAHTKDRSEVRGGGRKPWRQKGTGQARHGSIRSPIWIGGGVTFGPRTEKKYGKKVNKKMKQSALFSALSEKVRRGDVLFLDSLSLKEPKTKKVKEVLKALSSVFNDEHLVSKDNAFLILVPEHNEAILKSFRNIGTVKVEEVRNLNVLHVLSNKKLVFLDPKKSIEILKSRVTSSFSASSKK